MNPFVAMTVLVLLANPGPCLAQRSCPNGEGTNYKVGARALICLKARCEEAKIESACGDRIATEIRYSNGLVVTLSHRGLRIIEIEDERLSTSTVSCRQVDPTACQPFDHGLWINPSD